MKKVIVQFTFPGATANKYDLVWEELRKLGYSNPKGILHHVGGIQGDDLIVCDIWESLEAFNKFGEVLMPLMGKLGFPNVKPIITPVHYEYGGLQADITHKKAA